MTIFVVKFEGIDNLSIESHTSYMNLHTGNNKRANGDLLAMLEAAVDALDNVDWVKIDDCRPNSILIPWFLRRFPQKIQLRLTWFGTKWTMLEMLFLVGGEFYYGGLVKLINSIIKQ